MLNIKKMCDKIKKKIDLLFRALFCKKCNVEIKRIVVKMEAPFKISAMDLSKYVIAYVHNKGNGITHLKLQKILYFIQGEYIKQYNTPLFDEKMEAWMYGPVICDVYFQYCENGALELYVDSKEAQKVKDSLPLEVRNLIDSVLDKMGSKTSRELVQISHGQDPWKKYEAQVSRREKPEITEDDMRSYFRNNVK